jgi:hypothetical protein
MRNGRRAQHHRRTGDGKQAADGGAEEHAGIMPVRRTGRKGGAIAVFLFIDCLLLPNFLDSDPDKPQHLSIIPCILQN